MVHAKDLKKGDKVNFRGCDGWQTVVTVKKYGYNSTKIVFDSMFGRKEIIFNPRFDYLEKVSDGLYIVPSSI